MTGDLLLVLGAAAASAVETVEAVTIVLALGATRGWRSPLLGAGAAVAALAAVVAVLRPALEAIPIDTLRLVVGSLLLVFGLQWLRKAILRASGFKAIHDEDTIDAEEVAHALSAGRPEHRLDGYAFTVSFKSVLLEGLEIAFIVLTPGREPRLDLACRRGRPDRCFQAHGDHGLQTKKRESPGCGTRGSLWSGGAPM